MSWITDILKLLTRQLQPDSRAFKMPSGGISDRLDTALNVSMGRAYDDCNSILNAILPDNSNFTEDDATQWERRLAIINNPANTLADRKKSISQKMAYPGTVAPRSNYMNVRDQLIAAGFGITLVENNFGGVTRTPSEVIGSPVGTAILGMFQLGEAELAETLADNDVTVIANHIEELLDADFVFSPNYRSTFYIFGIGGYGTFASIPASRKDEFRQLILQLKPQQTVGFIFCIYT
jgi:hypothetical protein